MDEKQWGWRNELLWGGGGGKKRYMGFNVRSWANRGTHKGKGNRKMKG